MKSLELFYPLILPAVLGCPIPTVDSHIVRACRSFCDNTSAWTEWLPLITFDGETDTMDHDISSGQELIRYKRAVLNDDADTPYTVMSARDLPADWATGTSIELDQVVVHLDSERFQVFPMPADGDTLRLEASFKPALGVTQVADILAEDHAEAIADGALSTLMMINKQDWTDFRLSDYHGGRFQAAMHLAANKDFVRRLEKRTRPVG